MSGLKVLSSPHTEPLSVEALIISPPKHLCNNLIAKLTHSGFNSLSNSVNSSKTDNITSSLMKRLSKNLGNKTKKTILITASLNLVLLIISGQALAQDRPISLVNTQFNNEVVSNSINKQDIGHDFTETLIQLANQKSLATHPTWLRLHYYDTESHSKAMDYESKIDDATFFTSQKGKNNPAAELETFIRKSVQEGTFKDAYSTSNKTVTQTARDSLACRFPARTYWLQSQLGIEQTQIKCPEFDAWMGKLDPQRLSVVFAEEYPNRAVSAFGHTLMLIDSSESLANPKAIDKAHALNDTVGGDSNDSFAIYAVKSTLGGYPNEITIEPYPEKLSEYLQQDNRDVWTYALDLTDIEVQQIMRHVWETKDLELPYYFTLDNCASEILRYIDVVRPELSLLDTFKVAIVPSDVIKLLNKEGLITQQHYLPADDTLAQAKINNQSFKNPQLDNLPNSSITEKNKLVFTSLKPANNNTLDAHSRQRLMVGIGETGDDSYLSLAYRGGFNGLLDRPSGYPQNFHLEAGSIELRVYNEGDEKTNNHNQVELQKVSLLRGRSFNPINTADDGDSLLSSWGVSIEAIQVNDGSQMDRTLNSNSHSYSHNNSHSNKDNDPFDTSHLVGSLGYEKGVSMAFGAPEVNTGNLPPQLCYALGNGKVQLGKGLSKGYRVGVGVNLGCCYQLGNSTRLIGEVQLPYWYHGESSINQVQSHYWQPLLNLGAQYDLNKNSAVRFESSYQLHDKVDSGNNIQLSYVKYF